MEHLIESSSIIGASIIVCIKDIFSTLMAATGFVKRYRQTNPLESSNIFLRGNIFHSYGSAAAKRVRKGISIIHLFPEGGTEHRRTAPASIGRESFLTAQKGSVHHHSWKNLELHTNDQSSCQWLLVARPCSKKVLLHVEVQRLPVKSSKKHAYREFERRPWKSSEKMVLCNNGIEKFADSVASAHGWCLEVWTHQNQTHEQQKKQLPDVICKTERWVLRMNGQPAPVVARVPSGWSQLSRLYESTIKLSTMRMSQMSKWSWWN